MRKTLAILLLAGGWLAGAVPASGSFEQAPGESIDLVIALDTSGTMRELIEATRANIWSIVNELAEADPTPKLRVALLTYGNQTGSLADGWVRVETALTGDLDLVSERLFALKSRGANEYVGRAIQTALEQLDWSQSSGALRLLFVAGNEPADQELDVSFRDMSRAARDRDILLSALFCGRADHPDAVSWREMATVAEGQFATIDHKLPAAMVATEFDRELRELGALLNQTYIPVGDEGRTRRKHLVKEDRNARGLGPAVAATRAVTKASPFYSPQWDLINLLDAGLVDLTSLDDRELPRSMRAMTVEERLAFADDMRQIRSELRQRIADLGSARRRTVAERADSSQAVLPRSLDQIVRATIRQEARERGFDFPEDDHPRSLR